MSTATTSNGNATTTMTSRATRTRHADQLQIDVGTYIAYHNGDPVAEVFVERRPDDPNNANRSIEHWCLYAEFESPSNTNPDYPLQFKYASGQDPSATDFRARIRQITGVRYIQAACDQMDP
ncbi:MAG: hypothetical protein IT372_05835 [Polyangiaceae bacterium]|nr:hypothetical protein [Polyangiaceae bacterium]